jgi:hypothetical protein
MTNPMKDLVQRLEKEASERRQATSPKRNVTLHLKVEPYRKLAYRCRKAGIPMSTVIDAAIATVLGELEAAEKGETSGTPPPQSSKP